MTTPIKVTVLEVGAESLIVKTPDGQKWRLPVSSIHGKAAVGQIVRLIGVADASIKNEDASLAKALLNELLA